MAPVRLCGRRFDTRVLALSMVGMLVLLVVLLVGGDETENAPGQQDSAGPAHGVDPPPVRSDGADITFPDSPALPATTCRDDPYWVDTDGDDCTTCKLMARLRARNATLGALTECLV